MRTFVTGSTGLLGNNLVRILLQAGHEVWALARSKEKARRELGDTAARIVVGNIRNVPEFAYDLKGIDVVFHTAAYFREYYNPGDHSKIIELTNVRSTLELAQAAHAMGVGKMIHTSSAGTVGWHPDGSPGDEQTPPWPGTKKNLYLQSKGRAEQLLREFSREKGFFMASALPSWMWGPHEGDRPQVASSFSTRSRTSCLQCSRQVARRLWMHAMWLRACFVLRKSGAPESATSSAAALPSWLTSS